MTTVEQVALAREKVEHWRGKCERAASILHKWEARLTQLQAKDKPQPTAKKLPPVTLVAGIEHLMPRAAVTSAEDQAAARKLARESALADMAEADRTKGKVVPIKGKAKPKKPKKH
jgi:hypothetical protein